MRLSLEICLEFDSIFAKVYFHKLFQERGIASVNGNEQLIRHLTGTNALTSQNIIEAFRHVDRADFVPESRLSDAYGDYPLPIGHAQTISQPTTVAMMLEMLQPKTGDSVLDIGSGSGWTTALLAHIVGKSGYVIGIERIGDLVHLGRSNLKKYPFDNVTIVEAKESLGIVNKTFDKILVSASAANFPAVLLEQLNPNGKLVIPVQNSIYEVTKTAEDYIIQKHYGFEFVPLVF
jgi:protein-L-isoaspartate(D-aspartate) O-methyltransferase